MFTHLLLLALLRIMLYNERIGPRCSMSNAHRLNLSITSAQKQNLSKIAASLGFVNGSTPNISAMIAAVSDGWYVISPPLNPLVFSDDSLAVYDSVVSDLAQSVEQLKNLRAPY